MSRKQERQKDRNEKKNGRKEEKEELSKIRENKKAGNKTKKQGVWPIRQHTQGSLNGSNVEKTEGR